METEEIKVGQSFDIYRAEKAPYLGAIPVGSFSRGWGEFPGVEVLTRYSSNPHLYMSLIEKDVTLVGRMIITKLK